MLDSLRADVRYAFRQAARSPAFAGTVVATIALTVGASTILFSVYNGLVLRSLPVRDAYRIVLVQPIDEKGRNRHGSSAFGRLWRLHRKAVPSLFERFGHAD